MGGACEEGWAGRRETEREALLIHRWADKQAAPKKKGRRRRRALAKQAGDEEEEEEEGMGEFGKGGENKKETEKNDLHVDESCLQDGTLGISRHLNFLSVIFFFFNHPSLFSSLHFPSSPPPILPSPPPPLHSLAVFFPLPSPPSLSSHPLLLRHYPC